MNGVALKRHEHSSAGYSRADGRPITVLVLRSVSGEGGGAESIILKTAAQLHSSSVRQIICAFRRSTDTSFAFDKQVLATGCEYHEILQATAFDRTVWPQLQGVCDQLNVDLIESHDYKASYYARWLGQKLQVPTLATLHGWSGHKLREKYFYYLFDKLNVRSFSAVVAVSTQIRNTMIQWGANPASISLLPNAIDSNVFTRCDGARAQVRAELGIAPNDVLIGAAGRLEREKRFDVLIDAISVLHKRKVPVSLVIAGEGSLKEALTARIKSLGLDWVCRLLGHRRDMVRLYSALDIYAQSSDNEGTPGVLVEAMSCQVPIVATNVGGTADLIEDGTSGLLIPRRSPEGLADAIQRLITLPQLSEQMGVSARERVRRQFEFSQRTERLVNIYRSVTKHRSVTPGSVE